MADINLLQPAQGPERSSASFSHLNALGVLILVLIIALYAYFTVAAALAQKNTNKALEEKNKIETEIKSQEEYATLLSNQDKLKNIQTLLDEHLDWSKFFPSFQEATLKTATYSKVSATSDGGAIISGTVPDFQNLDKLIKAFQLSDFDFINDVKLTSIALASGEKTGIDFSIKITFNKSILEWDMNKEQE